MIISRVKLFTRSQERHIFGVMFKEIIMKKRREKKKVTKSRQLKEK